MKVRNEEKYRKLSEPVPRDEANANIAAFFEGVNELREKHHIPDVLCIVCVNVDYESGDGQAMTYLQAGDNGKSEAMAAYVYGKEQQARTEFMNRLLKGK